MTECYAGLVFGIYRETVGRTFGKRVISIGEYIFISYGS